MKTEKRKNEHIDICLNKDVSHRIKSTGFENYYFEHNALPEIDFKDIDVSTRFLGRKISAPFYISPITGGSALSKKININLAKAAQKLNIPMGVGSQRAALENSDVAGTFNIRNLAPDTMLFANLGAVQLNYGYSYKHCQKVIDMIKANALVLHLNPLQEAIQPEGNTNFSILLPKIKEIASKINVPLIAKEVGHGISGKTAKRLEKAGVECIDVAGAGGTPWSTVEGHRAKTRAGEVFRNWGLQTTECIKQAKAATKLEIIASGGIRSGLHAAKAIALGADIAGIAMPLLKPATKSSRAVEKILKQYIHELKTAMFCVSAKSIMQLKKTKLMRRMYGGRG